MDSYHPSLRQLPHAAHERRAPLGILRERLGWARISPRPYLFRKVIYKISLDYPLSLTQLRAPYSVLLIERRAFLGILRERLGWP